MLLKTKLAASFFGVLVLSALVGGVGWYGMSNMGKRADVAVDIENASMDLLLAKVSQLRFLVYGDSQEITLTRQFISESEQEFTHALNTITDPRRIEQVRHLLASLREYKEKVDVMVRQSEDIAEAENTVFALSAKVNASLAQLMQALENDSFAGAERFRDLNQAQSLFNEARLAVANFRAKPDRENAEAARKALAASRANLEKMTQALSLNQVQTQTFQKTLADYEERVNQVISRRDEQTAWIGDIHQLVINTVQEARQTVSTAVEALNQTQESSLRLVIGITVAAFVVGMFISWLLTRTVLRQLGRDPGDLAAIARRVTEGDFAIDNGDTSSGVFNDLKTMVLSLRQNIDKARREAEHAQEESFKAQQAMQEAEQARQAAIRAKQEGMLDAAGQLESIVGVITSAATQVSRQIETVEQGAMEQANRVTETATAMEEMNSAVLEVARNAGAASDVSTQTREKAMEGARVMEEAVNSIRSVQEQAAMVKSSMGTLMEHAQSINQIMNVISDIADQTNLLALNAAIEAARAGDAGRGFAVVADEVRKLAEKTVASTSDVDRVIKGIQESAKENMRQVDITVREIENATTLAGKSGVFLKEIVGMVDQSADQAQAIATASEEQSASSEEINRSILEVNTIAKTTVETMGEAARAIESLAGKTQDLDKLILQMKQG